MKYKVLLAGSNKKVINDFFFQLDFSFECMSSSMIFDDLKNHLNYFNPDIFIFCMSSESRDDVVTIANFHRALIKDNIPYAIIGDSSSIEFASKIPGGEPEFQLRSALTTIDIEEELIQFIQKYKTRDSYSNLGANPSNAISDTAKNTSDMLASLDSEIEAMQNGTTTDVPVFSNPTRHPEYGNRHRILVIDDSTIVHKAIKGFLDREYEVATAISGKVALRYLQAKEVSLILLDYEMPEMDGPAVLMKLREDADLARIPVVFLTGINDVDKIKNALALKPQGYLLKPVDKNALLDKIHELIP